MLTGETKTGEGKAHLAYNQLSWRPLLSSEYKPSQVFCNLYF
uniref:Uncharacterized protein n=1 Tax=Anguilla anguilla TaxID=7936 RepID=A0A0E9Q0P1_ANGAN